MEYVPDDVYHFLRDTHELDSARDGEKEISQSRGS